MADGLLIKQEKYLEAGIHIGTKLRVIDMQRFIYRTRSDGLYVLDLRKVDERIRNAGRLLGKFNPAEITVIASRAYSSLAANRFAQVTGASVVAGRFVPGRMTNVSRTDFIEPKVVIICDPKGERQAVVECGRMGIPTVGLCDTDNFTMFIDWVIPCNNKGRRSLALIFWLIAREMAMSSGKISSYDEFSPTLEEFEAQAVEAPAVDAPADGAPHAPTDAVEAPVSESPAPSAAEVAKEEKEAEDELKAESDAAKPKPKRAPKKKEEGESEGKKAEGKAKGEAEGAKAKKAEANDEKKAE